MRSILLALLAMLPLHAAVAQESGASDDRFRLERTEEGFVRMDTRTGEMSACAEEDGGQLVCRLAADDRDALEQEAERLRADLQALERRVAVLEKGGGTAGLPTDAELDRAFGLMENLFRRFKGLAEELSEESDTPPTRTEL